MMIKEKGFEEKKTKKRHIHLGGLSNDLMLHLSPVVSKTEN